MDKEGQKFTQNVYVAIGVIKVIAIVDWPEFMVPNHIKVKELYFFIRKK